MTQTLLYNWPGISVGADFSPSSHNPPHHAFKLTNALEWAGSAIGERVYNKVLINVTTSVRFAAQTINQTPFLRIEKPILSFHLYE